MALREQAVRMARRSLLDFTRYTMPTFTAARFHELYYGYLTRFCNGEFRKLMIFMPPQHGKSEGSTRRLPAYALGLNPDTRIAIVSYSAPKARKFNREIQRVIDSPEYHDLFPNTTLNASSVASVAGSWLRNADECEIVGRRGGFKTVGVGGPLTGEPVDLLILDDIYKDAKTAWSPTVRESISDWYNTVAETRLHNDSRQLIVFTRWHQDDLAGQLLREQGEFSAENPNGWVVVSYPAIKIGPPTEADPRQEGEALWPERHSLEKLQGIRDRVSQVFESLYQQNPTPKEGLLYEAFRTYSERPISKVERVKAYIDTADTGADFLCSIVYLEHPSALYVLDVIYTQKPMEETERSVARQLTRYGVQLANVESNNGGRGFARNLERNLRELWNRTTAVSWFHQTANKEARIYTLSGQVNNMVIMPEGWERKWPQFYNAVAGYRATGGNAHDDAPDALTGMVEKMNVGAGTKVGLAHLAME